MPTTPGRLLFEEIVPEKFRDDDDGSPIDAKKTKDILQRIAERSPQDYRDISHKLLQFGAKASVEVPASFSLEDLKSPIDKSKEIEAIEKEEALILADPTLTRSQRNEKLVKLYAKRSFEMPEKVFQAAMAKDSNLAKMVAAGARGSKGQLNSNIGADWLMLDADSNPIPIPIKSSYSDGLSPAEYFASAFGTRRGLISTKFSVQNSGYLSKQLAAAAHDLVVSERDCETDRGFPTDPTDNDNLGAVLARDTGPFPAGTVIDSRVLSQLKRDKVDRMLVRSPVTCGASGGVCSRCAGIKEKGRFPEIGDRVGLVSSSSVGEPLSQSTLSEKHSGGVASSSGKAVSAFKQIDSLVQVPEIFPNVAAVSKLDGNISKIEDAPQGGKFIYIGDERHYVDPDQEVLVKMGDAVEAGDVLSSGVPNPKDIVSLKGIGQGRIYFVNAFRNALTSNGIDNNRRQLEVIGRALVNNVRITNPEGYQGYLPDDVVEYSSIDKNFTPESSTLLPAKKAVGKFLAKPASYFSVGTRITPSVAKELELDSPEVEVMDSAPDFEPDMQRVMDVPSYKEDWMSQFAGSNLKKKLLSNVHSGDAVSDPSGPSFVPGLAKGVGFGGIQ